MTVVELQERRQPAERWATAKERRAAARAHWRAAARDGEELTGAALAARFGRSERWGRDRIAEAEAELPDGEDGSRTATRWPAVVLTVLVGLVAMAASYGHQYEVALDAGEPHLIAAALPATVDGLVIAALWTGHRGRWWLRLALAVSVAANVAAAEPTVIGFCVAAWPPLALYGTHRLLHHR